MTDELIQANGVTICTETFGDATHPAVLLIMGATASMVWWPEAFCRRLAATGRFVIRYDNRDTGRSITYQPGTCPYTMDDMTDDAIGVLDAYGIGQAHIAGMSMGGMLAQLMMLKYPERVLTATLISTSLFDDSVPGLPGMDERVLAHHAAGATLDWSDEAAVIDFMVEGWRVCAGSGHPFDEAGIRTLAAQEVRRADRLLSMFNHAQLSGGEAYVGRLGQIQAPTLVIHGTEDTILPYPHGVALAGAIPGAQIMTLQGTGHELHPADWPAIIGAMAAHTANK